MQFDWTMQKVCKPQKRIPADTQPAMPSARANRLLLQAKPFIHFRLCSWEHYLGTTDMKKFVLQQYCLLIFRHDTCSLHFLFLISFVLFPFIWGVENVCPLETVKEQLFSQIFIFILQQKGQLHNCAESSICFPAQFNTLPPYFSSDVMKPSCC